MTSKAVVAISLTAGLGVVGLLGCGSSTSSQSGAAKSASSPAAALESQPGGEHSAMSDMQPTSSQQEGPAAAATEMDAMQEGLAQLSDEDRAAAEKQHVCPVSGKMLGTMGAPVKVDVNGREVWICCSGCRDTLLENPDEYLAKLQP